MSKDDKNTLSVGDVITIGDDPQQLVVRYRHLANGCKAYMIERLHEGDPCIYCGMEHDDVGAGPCSGKENKFKEVIYA